MVGSALKLASEEVLFKVAQEMYYGEQFLSRDAIIIFSPVQGATSIGYDPFISVLALRQHGPN